MVTMLIEESCQNVSYIETGPFILIGIGFSIYFCSSWPCIPLVVKSNILGTAYGFAYSMLNLGIAISATI